MFKRM